MLSSGSNNFVIHYLKWVKELLYRYIKCFKPQRYDLMYLVDRDNLQVVILFYKVCQMDKVVMLSMYSDIM